MWSIMWATLAFDSPETHPRIKDEERRYLRNAIGKLECRVFYNQSFVVGDPQNIYRAKVHCTMCTLYSVQSAYS